MVRQFYDGFYESALVVISKGVSDKGRAFYLGSVDGVYQRGYISEAQRDYLWGITQGDRPLEIKDRMISVAQIYENMKRSDMKDMIYWGYMYGLGRHAPRKGSIGELEICTLMKEKVQDKEFFEEVQRVLFEEYEE